MAGLCYGVTYFQHYLANLIGMPWDALICRAIGVNHFTWITDLTYHGQSVWPQVRQVMEEKGAELGNPYTWELFRTFDAFPCVGDGHICEFVPGWQGEGAYYGQTFGDHLPQF